MQSVLDDQASDAMTAAAEGERSSSSHRLARALPIFSVLGSLGYFLCMGFNASPFAYYPLVGEFHSSPQPESLGPPMFWYGWIVYGALIGAAGSLLMLALPRRAALGLFGPLSWAVWVTPVFVVLATIYFLQDLLF